MSKYDHQQSFQPRYKFIDLLGKGGYGKIYLAKKLVDDDYNEYAVKRIDISKAIQNSSEERERRRINDEINALTNINHPSVVNIYDVVYYENYVFIEMKYIQGEHLDNIIHSKKISLDYVQSSQIMIKLLGTMQNVHQTNFNHLDLKPPNIIIARDYNPIIVDFGCSFEMNVDKEEYTKTSVRPHTYGYVAPEIVFEEYQRFNPVLADIFSLGSIFYTMLTKEIPSPNKHDLIRRLEKDGPPLRSPHEINPKIPESFSNICMKAINMEATERYQSCGLFSQELNSLLEQEGHKPPQSFSSYFTGLFKKPDEPKEIKTTVPPVLPKIVHSSPSCYTLSNNLIVYQILQKCSFPIKHLRFQNKQLLIFFDSTSSTEPKVTRCRIFDLKKKEIVSRSRNNLFKDDENYNKKIHLLGFNNKKQFFAYSTENKRIQFHTRRDINTITYTLECETQYAFNFLNPSNIENRITYNNEYNLPLASFDDKVFIPDSKNSIKEWNSTTNTFTPSSSFMSLIDTLAQENKLPENARILNYHLFTFDTTHKGSALIVQLEDNYSKKLPPFFRNNYYLFLQNTNKSIVSCTNLNHDHYDYLINGLNNKHFSYSSHSNTIFLPTKFGYVSYQFNPEDLENPLLFNTYEHSVLKIDDKIYKSNQFETVTVLPNQARILMLNKNFSASYPTTFLYISKDNQYQPLVFDEAPGPIIAKNIAMDESEKQLAIPVIYENNNPKIHIYHINH